jgi:hypothetical protein
VRHVLSIVGKDEELPVLPGEQKPQKTRQQYMELRGVEL